MQRMTGWAQMPLLCLLLATPAAAQRTTTCTPIGRDVVCTESKPKSGGIAAVLDGLAQDRAANAAKASASAADQLFVDRAVMVLTQSRDSLAFSSADHAAKLDSLYWDEGSRTMGLLHTANPMASTQQMREALEPVTDKYRRLKRKP